MFKERAKTAAAQAVYETYDFGSDLTVEDAGGWEYSQPGDVWVRRVFVRPDEQGPSQKISFVVRFSPGSNLMRSAYAIDDKGQLIGKRCRKSPVDVAIEALQVAAADGGELDQPQYAAALAELGAVRDELNASLVDDGPLRPFTVISTLEPSGQILSDHVEAVDGDHAFRIVAEELRPDSYLLFVCAVQGHLQEGAEIEFAGAGLVDSDTVLDQIGVFRPRAR